MAERLPDEPLVVAPYDSIGKYGGVFDMISNNTEAGTSDLLSTRHVNLVRYSNDLPTIVPNIAKSWSWNDDFTQLTFKLRKGHKWSDGAPFTADDVVFFFNDIELNSDLRPKTRKLWVIGGEPVKAEKIDDLHVQLSFAVPVPGFRDEFGPDQ